MGIQGCVKVVAILVGKERNVKKIVIQTVRTIHATKTQEFVQVDASQVGLETHVINSVLGSGANRLVIYI